MNVEVNQEALIELKKQLTPLNAGKIVFGTLISIGATAAIIAALSNPLKASKGIIKLLMAAGVFVLACKAGDIAENHFKEKVDSIAETVRDFQKEVNEEIKKEGETQNGRDTNAGRNSEQQPEKPGLPAVNQSGKTPGASVRRRWWCKKERTEQGVEMVQKDVSERQKSKGDNERCGGKPGSPGD